MAKTETTEASVLGPLVSSDLALIDVKIGRGKLFKALGYPRIDSPAPIPVTITGYIVGAYGADDGTSQTFEVKVTGVKLSP
jgi:hypothetical protein